MTAWSDGTTTMRAFSERRMMRYVAHATLGAVLRCIGSLSTFSRGNSGNCSSTKWAYSWFVLT